jgi:hypothetical protein
VLIDFLFKKIHLLLPTVEDDIAAALKNPNQNNIANAVMPHATKTYGELQHNTDGAD